MSTDKLWLLARYFEDICRLTVAKKVPDVLVGRDDTPEGAGEIRVEVTEEGRRGSIRRRPGGDEGLEYLGETDEYIVPAGF